MHVLDKQTLRDQLVTARNINKQMRYEIDMSQKVIAQQKEQLKQFEWIDINDRQPEDGQFVNICGGDLDGVSAGYYEPHYGCNAFNCAYDDEFLFLGVTHWMPLPKPKD